LVSLSQHTCGRTQAVLDYVWAQRNEPIQNAWKLHALESVVEHLVFTPGEVGEKRKLALLRHEHSFTRWSKDVREIASALNEKTAIPMVREQLELIIELQTDEYWQDVTAEMLEDVRKRLRSLVKFIDKTKRPTIYTDFTHTICPVLKLTSCSCTFELSPWSGG